jgi:hypothetical protein
MLTPSDSADGDFFGGSVALSEHTLVVGAPTMNACASSAYVFLPSGTTWTEEAKLVPDGTAPCPGPFVDFGADVAVDAGTVAVGAPGDENGVSGVWGAAYVFRLDGLPPNGSPTANAGPDQTVAFSPVGVQVILDGTVSTDPEGDSLTYTWSGTFAGGTTTGSSPTVAFDSPGTFEVTLSVDDGFGGVDSDSVSIRVNEAPLATGFTTSLAEDSAVGTAVGTVIGSDAEGDPLAYAIAAGDGAGLFTIGSATGAITTVAGLDYETASQHVLTVTVSDGTSGIDAAVTVNVTDVGGPLDVVVDPNANTFGDDDGSIFEEDVEWLAAAGITKGCNPPVDDMFCPDDRVTRGQMAAFLVRALGLVDDGGGNSFTDDDGSIFEDAIAKLAAAGITKGCNPPTNDMFCPDDGVTRGQMAAFLVRALGYTDDGGGDLFVDDDSSVFEANIDRLATAGVTKGCNPPTNDRFCPDDNVTRGQMAAFLHRALG